MTVRLDAAEKLVIRCADHVRDGRLVDPAVAQPLAATQQRVKTWAVGGRTCAMSVDVVVCDMYRLKESSSSVDSSKGHTGSNSSLHRATSLSLPSLTHRSKSFQSKLNFGDTSDDIHVGVQCMRAIMNNQVSLCRPDFANISTCTVINQRPDS